MTQNCCPSVVRVAGPHDYDEVARLLWDAHTENQLFGASPDRVKWWVDRCLHPESIHPLDTGIRGIIGCIGPKGGHLEALVVLTLGQFWYTSEKHIEEFLIYVDKNHRRSRHARALIEFMKQQVEECGIPLLTGVISNIRTQAKCHLYRKLLPKAGEFFFLAPKGSHYPQFAVEKSSGW